MGNRQVADAFADYLGHLYSQNTPLMSHDLPTFLKDLPTRKLTTEERNAIEEDLTEEELGNTLSQLQSRTSAGSNGYPVEFFKASWSQLGTHVRSLL